ncbi:hypothetical protein Rhe02_28770 [Rhizocola hellebori]|uniref:Uncharacterized protein n=1 Tax=Rhizocola hellebori TaxID=1392758 RepID=A0A8J3VFT4_9ACTN|nr:hypothetical protein Rhe02_28770 [Rhizocola hellebori]
MTFDGGEKPPVVADEKAGRATPVACPQLHAPGTAMGAAQRQHHEAEQDSAAGQQAGRVQEAGGRHEHDQATDREQG